MSLFGKIVAASLFLLSIGFAVLLFLYFRINTLVSNSQFGSTEATTSSAVALSDTTESASLSVLQQELKQTQASTAALLDRVEKLESGTPVTKTYNSGTSQIFQKQIVHIGSASTTQNEWTDTGVEVTLNSADYPSNVNATFEVGLSIVSGEAWARLVNKTTGAILTVTEVSAASSTTTWKSSAHFKLHNGTNIYQVQVRSSSGEVANISSARIILTN